MTEIPELTLLVDLAEGRLDPAAARTVGERLASGDASVAAARDWVAWFHRAAGPVTFAEVPPDLVARLHALMPVRPSLVQRLAAAAGGVVAQLVQDTGLGGPLLAGARGVPVAEPRQLLFEAGQVEVAVSVVPPVDGRTRIDGQLFADDPARPVELVAGDRRLAAVADAAGEFSFPLVELPAGWAEISLTIDTAHGPVHLDLTPPAGDGVDPDPQEHS
ncbi:MAG: hypothetical protein R2761_05565 [Acidimicrobiales bacterium]